jgi:hypothetical protein
LIEVENAKNIHKLAPDRLKTNTMDAAIQEKINAWLNGNYDEATKTAITKLQKENPDELADAFYQNLRIWYRWFARHHGCTAPTESINTRLAWQHRALPTILKKHMVMKK